MVRSPLRGPARSRILGVGLAKLQRVVTDNNCALAQVGRDQGKCRPSHRRPGVDEHEVDRPLYGREGFSQIPFAQVDEMGQAGFGEMTASDPDLLRFRFSADHDARMAQVVEARGVLQKVVAHGGGQKQGGDPERGPRLDDAASLERATHVITELCLGRSSAISLSFRNSLVRSSNCAQSSEPSAARAVK